MSTTDVNTDFPKINYFKIYQLFTITNNLTYHFSLKNFLNYFALSTNKYFNIHKFTIF